MDRFTIHHTTYIVVATYNIPYIRGVNKGDFGSCRSRSRRHRGGLPKPCDPLKRKRDSTIADEDVAQVAAGDIREAINVLDRRRMGARHLPTREETCHMKRHVR